MFVNTPSEICQQRDSKGLYKKANSGDLNELSGVGQQSEHPMTTDLEIRAALTIAQAVVLILAKIMAT